MANTPNNIKKIAIITTQQNYKWISMQEVLPSIEKCWELCAIEITAESKIFNVDVDPLRNYISYLLHCDVIIIIAFNETIARFMKEVRQTLNLQIPFIFHLHGHASIGLWPQFRFGVTPVLNAGDSFIGTCPGDLKCTQIIGSNLLSFNIPYPYFQIPLDLTQIIDDELKFAYIGRISDQKNIEVLIEAYYLLSLENENLPLFYIYGKEDHFGSPNMGIPSTKCFEELQEQIQKLNIGSKIVFKGFKNRTELYSELGRKHIFLSASTHSDENFGMALLRSLAIGSMAVVTSWGGHVQFKKHFPDKVWMVPIEFKNSVPKPDAHKFKVAMQQALDKSTSLFTNKSSDSIPSYFLPQTIVKEYIKILEKISFSSEPLNISISALEIYQQQRNYESNGDFQRIFTSYDDPLAQLFLKSYQVQTEQI